MLLLVDFQQNNCRIEVLAKGLGNPNSLISGDPILSLKVGNCWRQLHCSWLLHITLIFRLGWQIFQSKLPNLSYIFVRGSR